MNDLTTHFVCTVQQKVCFIGACDNCPTEKLMNIVTQNNATDLDEECGWTVSKKINNKFDLQQITGLVDSLLTEIEDKLDVLLFHVYCNRQQREHLKEVREKSTDKTFLVAQIDFSMNCTLVRQHQATLFTIHLTVG